MRKPAFAYVSDIETTPEKLQEALTDSAFIPPDAPLIAELEEVYRK